MAPSIVDNLIAYQLYKPSEDVAPVQRKSKAKRRRRGKRAGRRVQARRERCVLQGGDHCIPVIFIVRNNNRIKRPRNNRYLTRVVTTGYSAPMPTLRPYSPDNPVDHLHSNSSPPVLKPLTLNAKTYLPNLILCNARSLTNKVDELELVLRINLAPLEVITECWDMTTETGAIKGYLNFFNTRRDRENNRRGGGVGIY